jgi:hypothetical protein
MTKGTETIPEGRKWQKLVKETTPQVRTITCNDEESSWRRSNHLMETRLLSSSDDCEHNFFRTSHRSRTGVMISLAMLCLGLFNYTYDSSSASVLPLFTRVHVSIQALAEMLTLPLPTVCHVINLLLAFATTCSFTWFIEANGQI